MGQAVPEIPLSVGSKLELHVLVLLRAFVLPNFRILPGPVHSRICPRMYLFCTIFADRVINPRRACAGGVTVLVLSVCLSVCPSVTT